MSTMLSSTSTSTSSKINPLATDADIIYCVTDFVELRQYLYFAPVRRAWRDSWVSGQRRRPAATSYVTSSMTASQIRYGFDSGGLPRDELGVCNSATRLGSLALLQCAREHGCPWNEWTRWLAAIKGNLRLCRWARENGCP